MPEPRSTEIDARIAYVRQPRALRGASLRRADDVRQSLIRILCVDDHPLLLDGVAALICTEPDMKLVAEATSELRQSGNSGNATDITLMDLQMRG